MEKKTIFTNELLRLARERSGISQETLKQSLHAIYGALSQCLNGNQDIVIDGFGRFYLKTMKERITTPPPPNNKPVIVPEHQIVKFKPFKNILLYNVKY